MSPVQKKKKEIKIKKKKKKKKKKKRSIFYPYIIFTISPNNSETNCFFSDAGAGFVGKVSEGDRMSPVQKTNKETHKQIITHDWTSKQEVTSFHRVVGLLRSGMTMKDNPGCLLFWSSAPCY